MNTEIQIAVSGIVTLLLGEKLKTVADKRWIAGLALVMGIILNAIYASLTGGTLASALAPGLAAGGAAISVHEGFSKFLGGLLKKS